MELMLRSWPASPIRRTFHLFCCAVLMLPGEGLLLAQDQKAPEQKTETPAKPPDAAAEKEAPKISNDQLDSLVAPIALYPDSLMAQVLVASTYPLEIVQLHQWLEKNKELKDKALVDAVAKQPWDASIQSMAATPEVVKRLADDIQWTTDLGNAFLAQQSDVMDSVQRMRKKAKDNGALKSNEQQKVETKTIEDKTVIIVESANPEVVYVPSYSPTVVYGPPVYPYPPIYYPPYYAGAAFVSFSFGVMWGAAWGGACCGCGWGGNDIDINVDNNFNNINMGDRGDGGNRGGSGNRPTTGNRAGSGNKAGGGKWQHNPSHRGGTPYGDRSTANKYGGTARGDSRPSAGQQGGAGTRGGSPGVADRSAGGAANRGGSPGVSDRSAGGRGGGASAGGGDKIGSRNISPSSGSKSSAFSGGSSFSGRSSFSGSSARASSSRGASSMGGRGGGGRGGGGGRRR